MRSSRSSTACITAAPAAMPAPSPWLTVPVAGRVARLRRALVVDDTPRGMRAVGGTVPPPGEPPEASSALLRELYAELIAPVEAVMPRDGSPVVIEPHRDLWLVPFTALLDSDGTWLGDKWPLLYAASVRILDQLRRQPARAAPADLTALIVGNPMGRTLPADDDPRFRLDGIGFTLEPLPGAEAEAARIGELFLDSQRTILLGPSADRTALERHVRDAGIVHLASHALALPDSPLDSFIVLGGSDRDAARLTGRHAMSLSLSADLVTLSACQTGLGKVSGDGIIGLSRAFLAAGARSVLVSQWSVSDQATADLMVAFYRRYLMEGEDKTRALQLATREVRATRGYDQPRYWAPFILIGAEK